MIKQKGRRQPPKNIPGIVIFAPIGDELNNVLAVQSQNHANTKRLIIEKFLTDSTRTVVLYHENHEPSRTAALLMTSALPLVRIFGVPCSALLSTRTFNKVPVLNRMEEYEELADVLILVGTDYVCRDMLNCYAEAKNMNPFSVQHAGSDELYVLNTTEKASYISYVDSEVSEEIAAEPALV